ncbi:hypothetical protein F5148DRAFT_479712 [Russula earlei]|uniref:Uncharacterized protein n=1 Tax=Russula earlei TaxID=71964 RepID=A0ACC0UII2_9AGAM|nr:hypothetical protein F5148DRAFT_479712 [Russula earlei]
MALSVMILVWNLWTVDRLGGEANLPYYKFNAWSQISLLCSPFTTFYHWLVLVIDNRSNLSTLLSCLYINNFDCFHSKIHNLTHNIQNANLFYFCHILPLCWHCSIVCKVH